VANMWCGVDNDVLTVCASDPRVNLLFMDGGAWVADAVEQGAQQHDASDAVCGS